MGNKKALRNIYEINTCVWFWELSNKYRKKITLASIPEEEILRLKELGFDAIWLMGVWLQSRESRKVALNDKKLRDELSAVLPQVTPKDISCSPYAIAGYRIDESLGNSREMLEFKKRLQTYGIKLLLDFVPNHVALDHPWVREHSEYFINGTAQDIEDNPGLFFLTDDKTVLAHGKDPYFSPWMDVVQLNYYNPETVKVMVDTLMSIASLCDGVRCDMAMLILKRIQKQIWGNRIFFNNMFSVPEVEFWQQAISEVRKIYPTFSFIAEVYWGLESELVSLGFDYVYDKSFYDALKETDVESIKTNLTERGELAKKRLRFIENHDENRAARVFDWEKLKAAAFLLAVSSGAHLLHQGQIEGFKIKLLIYLKKSLGERIDERVVAFYEKLLATFKNISLNMFSWDPATIFAAWDGNETYKNFIILFSKTEGSYYLAVANYSDSQSQCYTRFDISAMQEKELIFKDLLNLSEYARDKEDIISRGLYLDIPKYSYHLFKILAKE